MSVILYALGLVCVVEGLAFALALTAIPLAMGTAGAF